MDDVPPARAGSSAPSPSSPISSDVPDSSDRSDGPRGGTPPRPAPLLRLLGLSVGILAGELDARLRAAGFLDQRSSDNAVMPHIPLEGIRLTDLASRAGVTKQAMAELVDSSERRGYIERRPDPADGRAKLICFTPKGLAAVSAALDALDDIERDLIDRLGQRRVRELRRTLSMIADEE